MEEKIVFYLFIYLFLEETRNRVFYFLPEGQFTLFSFYLLVLISRIVS